MIDSEDSTQSKKNKIDQKQKNDKNRQKEIMVQIIGAGLCRTGTSSTLVALENLNLGPVYHYNEVGH